MNKNVLLLLTPLLFTATIQAKSFEERVAECTKIEQNDKRLSCFDNVTRVKSTTTAVAVSTKNEIAKGSTPPKEIKSNPSTVTSDDNSTEEIFGVEHKRKIEGPSELIYVIKKVKTNPYGQRKFTFENGQIWSQTDSVTKGSFKPGSEVIIKRGVFNSFNLKKVGSNRTIKVKRIK